MIILISLKKVYEKAFELANRFDAFQDNPWPILYKELDRKFPGSKFMLTLRPSDAWIRSVVNHFGKGRNADARVDIQSGTRWVTKTVYIARYERHNREVMEYFNNRSEQLLVFNITAGEGWTKRCRSWMNRFLLSAFHVQIQSQKGRSCSGGRAFGRGGCIAVLGGVSSS